MKINCVICETELKLQSKKGLERHIIFLCICLNSM